MSNSPRNTHRRRAGIAIMASAGVLTFSMVLCSSVLGFETGPLRIVARLQVLGGGSGSWGAFWESLSRPPAAYQQDALVIVLKTVTQLGIISALIASLSLVLHTVSRILGMWRPLAIRCALGATMRHLLPLVGRELALLSLKGCAAGAAVGALALAGLVAYWPPLFSRPSLVTAAAAALIAAVLAILIVSVIAVILLLILQRGVRSAAELHGTHVTSGGGLLFIQNTLAVLQLAALMMVTHGCALIVRTASSSLAYVSRSAVVDSALISSVAWAGVPGSPTIRADRLRAALPVLAPRENGAATAIPDAWLGMGKQVTILAVCGECRIGEYLRPLNSAVVRMVAVAPGALGLRSISVDGRDFTAGDTIGAGRVAIINDNARRALFPGGIALGKPVHPGSANGPPYTVVGVTDFEAPPIFGNEGPVPVVFVPILQHPPVAAEAAAPRDDLAGAQLRVAAMPADAPSFGNSRRLADRMREFIDPISWFGALFAGLAGSATGIATYSLVAVMIQMVALRERDIAVRIAVGATPRQVERWVVARTLWMTVAGTAIGLSGARWIAVRLHGPQHYTESDLLWLGGMVLGFCALGIVASWIPARRAARVEPMVVWAKVE